MDKRDPHIWVCLALPTQTKCSQVQHQTQGKKGQTRAVGGFNVAMPHKNTIQLNEVDSQSQLLQNVCVCMCVGGGG